MKWISNKWPILGEKLSENPSPRPRWQDWCGGAMLAMMVLASFMMMVWSLPAPSLADNWPREEVKGMLYAHNVSAESVWHLEKASACKDTLHNCK
ncbi:hypothetical protein ACNSPD_04030 [Yersinia enterocolitica]|uniref:hypothetical protein n=1 Tax=Yersinia TaxID=629 RepID=UPI003AB6F51C